MRRNGMTLGLALYLGLISLACMGSHRVEQVLPPGIVRFENASAVQIKDGGGQVLLGGKFATTAENDREIRRRAELTNPADDDWKGVIAVKMDREAGTVTRDEIELSVTGLPENTRCAVTIDDIELTSFMTDDDGEAEAKLTRQSRN